MALCPAHDGAGDVEGGTGKVLAGDDELFGHDPKGFEIVDTVGEGVHHFGRHERHARYKFATVRRRGRHLRHEDPEVALDGDEDVVQHPRAEIPGSARRDRAPDERPGVPDCGLGLVDSSIAFDPRRVLLDTTAIEKPGRAGVAFLRCDGHAKQSKAADACVVMLGLMEALTVVRRPLWRRTNLVLAVLGLISALALTACGSTSSKATTTTSGGTTTLPSLAVSKSEIDQAFMTLFDLSNPAVAPKLKVVQDGASLQAAFAKALKSSLAKLAGGARVLTIKIETGGACKAEVLPSPCAAVKYDVLSPNNDILLQGSNGFAVYENPHWLVSKSTICTLLTLENGGLPEPGC